MLKANINTQLRNSNGQSALDLANQLKNFECAKQINNLLAGKPVGQIDWFFLLEEDYLSDGIDEIDSMLHTRPVSMIITTPELSNDDLLAREERAQHRKGHIRAPSDPFNFGFYLGEERKAALYIPKGSVKVLPQISDTKKKSQMSKKNNGTPIDRLKTISNENEPNIIVIIFLYFIFA